MGEISPKLRKVLEMVKPEAEIPVIVELSVPLAKEVISNLEGLGFTVKEQIPTVNMVSGKIKASLVEQLAALPVVAKVYYDEPVTIQSEPFFRIKGKDSVLVPVSGATTGRVMGVDSVWFQYGYTGKGVKVAVLDTGVSTKHPMLVDAIVKTESMVEGESVEDHHGHGCLSADTKVLVSMCGLRTLGELWDKVNVDPVWQQNGEVKWISDVVYTPCLDGVTRVRALYRTRAKQKVIIETKYGTIESTTWHKFFVARPRKHKDRKNKYGNKDTHPRWYNGYDVVEVEAKDLKKGDVLIASTYIGQTWSTGLDPMLAYLHGLITGDGTVIWDEGMHRYEIRIFDKNRDFLEKVADIVKGKGPKPYIRKHKGQDSYELGFYSKELVNTIRSLELNTMLKDLEATRAWIAGFFDAEGYYYDGIDKKEIVICNTDFELLHKLRDVLLNVGIYARIGSGGESKGSVTKHLSTPDVDLFYEFIKPYTMSDKIRNPPKRESYNHPVKRGTHILVTVSSVRLENCDEWFYDLSTEDQSYSANGIIVHNSWCAATIAGRPYEGMLKDRMYEVTGMAPEAEIIAIKVLSNDGSGQTSWVLKGMEKAAELGADVISMSLGSMVSEAGRSPDSKMVDALSKKGILCIVAAGNSALPLSIGSPGDARGAITVGSVAYQLPTPLIPSTFSSRGPTVDLRIKPTVATFGGNVLPEMTELLVSAGKGTSLTSMAGTSMSTPHISGITALMLQAGLPRDRDILEFVFSRVGTKRVPIPFKDTDYGWGVPNVFKAISERTWSQPEAESFNVISERVQQVTMPLSTMLEPLTVKAAQLMGVEMTPRLAVIS